jgi:hypothetical protein
MMLWGKTVARKMVCSCEGSGKQDVIVKTFDQGDDLEGRISRDGSRK